MTGPRSAAGAAVLALVSAAAPAVAHSRVVVGGFLALPAPYRYDAWGRRYPAWMPPHLE